MLGKRLTISCVLTTLAASSWTFASEVPDLYKAKQALMAYHDSGQYMHDMQAMTNAASRYVEQRIKQNNQSKHPKKLAAVFDIDETVLSNYANFVRMNFGGSAHEIKLAEAASKDPAIDPVKKLYNQLKTKNVSIFFVTGRDQDLRKATVDNLGSAGFTGYKAVYFKPTKYPYKSAIPYKSSVRRTITEMGYDIILTVGDQWSDLNGGYADQAIKLPNPYYYIP